MLYTKERKEIQSSNRIPIDLKEKFRLKIVDYLAENRLTPELQYEHQKRVLEFIRVNCVENNIASTPSISKVYNSINTVGLEKILSFDADSISMIKSVSKKTAGLLYEIVSYCQKKGLDLDVQNKQVGIIEDRLDKAKELLRKSKIKDTSGAVLAELLRQLSEKPIT